MYANILGKRRRFLLPVASICALCGLTGGTWAQDEAAGEPVVNVTDYDVVDLAVQDADLAQVLQMLSLQSRKNIITSKNVSATVTANLYDVTFHEALDAILKVNGFVWKEDGNFIHIYTAEEWKKIQEESRELVTRIFDLNYLSAEDALAIASQMIGENGKAAAQGAVQAGFQPEMGDGGADSYAYNVRVVVSDYPETLDAIAATFAELDTPPDQVRVEAAIIQTKVDEANAFGVDFSIIGDMNFADIISPLNPVNALLAGGEGKTGFQPDDNKAVAGQSTAGNTTGRSTLKIGVVTDDISVFLRVLDEVTDTVLLAKPTVTALNRQRAEVLVGARVGYLSTTATETTTTQTVEFLDTGVQLVFRPFISKDGSIRMELRPSVSEASLRTVTDSNGALVTIPDELTNELTTNVRVRDGQTLVLGGLFREATTISRRQVPFLGDVPIIGAAFRGQDDSVERAEIIFLITPTITHDQMLTEDGQEALAMAELARIGARSGLLVFSREKMTVAHNQKAMAALEEGNTELALYHIRNSLRLNAMQPEVIAMRQQATGELEESYERSLLRRVLDRGMHRIGDPDNDGQPERVSQQQWKSDPMATLEAADLQPIAPQGEGEAEFAEPALDEVAPESGDAQQADNAEAESAESDEAQPFDWTLEPATSTLESFDNLEAEESFDSFESFESPEAETPVESGANSDDEQSDEFSKPTTDGDEATMQSTLPWFSRWFAAPWFGFRGSDANLGNVTASETSSN